LVSGASAAMWGYQAELKRTMIIGSASDDQQRFFEHMKAAQDVAFEALKPGAPCGDVDRAVRDYYEQHDLMPGGDYGTNALDIGLGVRFSQAYSFPFSKPSKSPACGWRGWIRRSDSAQDRQD
jgi:Xaa-Pro aminopeptidase